MRVGRADGLSDGGRGCQQKRAAGSEPVPPEQPKQKKDRNIQQHLVEFRPPRDGALRDSSAPKADGLGTRRIPWDRKSCSRQILSPDEEY
jgi:hypothetical protein